ncbi:MAG: DNA recombination protein RmuC [Actinobacteria bacterium]|nr:DNA recombination protein RmuC [Actinomycetota bacterium]
MGTGLGVTPPCDPAPRDIIWILSLVVVVLLAACGAAGAAVVVGRQSVAQMLEANRVLMASERDRVGETLTGQQGAFAAQLEAMRTDLTRVTSLVREFEDRRGAKLDHLRGQPDAQQMGLRELAETTRGLREALSSSKARGQWGERMAEDVLRLAGFVEGIQYRKQRSVAGGTGIPDYTFLLPRGSVCYMDVKFPLDNYQRFLGAESELEAVRFCDAFLRDVRAKVTELADREYTRADDSSVDCVLLFIPNEALYAFIHEHDGGLADVALGRGIVLCSPLTLFAVLAVIRQAVDQFRLERTAGQILDVLADFSKQWSMFTEQMDKMGKGLEAANKAYDELSSTRTRQLDRRLDRIDALRSGAELSLVEAEGPLALDA